jgi:hypothetical protein
MTCFRFLVSRRYISTKEIIPRKFHSRKFTLLLNGTTLLLENHGSPPLPSLQPRATGGIEGMCGLFLHFYNIMEKFSKMIQRSAFLLMTIPGVCMWLIYNQVSIIETNTWEIRPILSGWNGNQNKSFPELRLPECIYEWSYVSQVVVMHITYFLQNDILFALFDRTEVIRWRVYQILYIHFLSTNVTITPI